MGSGLAGAKAEAGLRAVGSPVEMIGSLVDLGLIVLSPLTPDRG
jgi:hypothetical protein